MPRTFGSLLLVCGVAVLAAGCDEKKSAEAARGDAAATTDKYAAADPKLERALRAAADASSGSENGPPPDGVFAPQEADRRHPKGVVTKVDLIAEGSEPRTALSPLDDALAETGRTASYGPATLEVAVQLGPRNVLNVDFALQLGAAKKDDGGPDWLVASVKHATAAKDQFGQVPADIAKAIGGLEGSQFRVQLTSDGRESDSRTVLSRGGSSDLNQELAQDGIEALVLATVPLPAKPMGVGGQWIAETRMTWAGVDVVAYRAYRVKSIDGDRVRLTVMVKAYAASSEAELPGLPKGSTLQQFQGEAQGELEVVPGEVIPRRSTMQHRLLMMFQAPGTGQETPRPGEPNRGMMSAQVQGQAVLERGDDRRSGGAPRP